MDVRESAVPKTRVEQHGAVRIPSLRCQRRPQHCDAIVCSLRCATCDFDICNQCVVTKNRWKQNPLTAKRRSLVDSAGTRRLSGGMLHAPEHSPPIEAPHSPRLPGFCSPKSNGFDEVLDFCDSHSSQENAWPESLSALLCVEAAKEYLDSIKLTRIDQCFYIDEAIAQELRAAVAGLPPVQMALDRLLEIVAAFRRWDANADGMLEYAEVVASVQRAFSSEMMTMLVGERSSLRERFDEMDENGDGKLSFGGKSCHSSFDCCVANGRRWQQNSTTCVWRTACSSGS